VADVSEQVRAGLPRLDDLQAFVDRSPVATMMFGLPRPRVRVANEALAELVGSPESAIVGLRPAQVWAGGDGRRSQLALSGLTAGAVDSYRARRQLQTSRGPLAVSVWVHRMQVVTGSVAVVIVVPETEATFTTRSVGAFFGPEALDLEEGYQPADDADGADDAAGDLPPRPDADRIATLERHLMRFAAELHSGGWRDAKPLAVDASRFAALDKLPTRQREIVDRLLRGERIPAIAESMYISASTVRNHLSHVFTAFGVHSQSELLAVLRSDSADAEAPNMSVPPMSEP
jgi:DNA-binding CsgD family transcriptional regulator